MATAKVGLARRMGQALYRCALEAAPAPLSLSIQFRRTQRRWPNLRHPTSFNEKLQWRKLHDRSAILPLIVDKVAVKQALAQDSATQDWLIPTLWTGARVSAEILAKFAPPYVIKPNNTSGRILINRDSDADLRALAGRANAMLATPHPRFLREWPYRQVRPQLLIEPFIGADFKCPVDYKFYVFHGRASFIQVDTDRHSDHKRALYAPDWRRMPFQYKIAEQTRALAPPTQLESMVAFAERVASRFNLDFIRVDLYQVGEHPYFGELTPFPSSGLAKFEPMVADFEIGRLWRLPEARARGHGIGSEALSR